MSYRMAICPTRMHFSRTFATETAPWPYPISSSERIKDRKSAFMAHASSLPKASLFPRFLDHLTASGELKRATHCMYAFRSGDQCLGQNDGGESGSGDHLARLLQLTGCENVVVVVSRWYGGVQLGADRWKRISHVAKEALNMGDFVPKKQEKDKSAVAGSKNSKKKRRR